MRTTTFYLTLSLAALAAGGMVVRAGFWFGLYLVAAGLCCGVVATIHYERSL